MMKLNRVKKREKEISFTFSFSLLDSFCLVSFLVFIFHFRHANEGISGCRLFVCFFLAFRRASKKMKDESCVVAASTLLLRIR